jgi:hypothetical protein
MVFNVIFNNISALRGSQFYWWRKAEYMDKTTDLPQVTDKLYHITHPLIIATKWFERTQL